MNANCKYLKMLSMFLFNTLANRSDNSFVRTNRMCLLVIVKGNLNYSICIDLLSNVVIFLNEAFQIQSFVFICYYCVKLEKSGNACHLSLRKRKKAPLLQLTKVQKLQGNPDRLLSFVQNHIIDGLQSVSTVMLTDLYGCKVWFKILYL